MGKSIEINNKLYSDIEKYCSLNNIKNINEEIETYIIQGFNIARYGLTPFEKDIPITKEEPKKEKITEPIDIIEIKPKENNKTIETKETKKPTRKVRIVKSE